MATVVSRAVLSSNVWRWKVWFYSHWFWWISVYRKHGGCTTSRNLVDKSVCLTVSELNTTLVLNKTDAVLNQSIFVRCHSSNETNLEGGRKCFSKFSLHTFDNAEWHTKCNAKTRCLPFSITLQVPSHGYISALRGCINNQDKQILIPT